MIADVGFGHVANFLNSNERYAELNDTLEILKAATFRDSGEPSSAEDVDKSVAEYASKIIEGNKRLALSKEVQASIISSKAAFATSRLSNSFTHNSQRGFWFLRR